MILETVSVGPMEANCYILAEKEGLEAVIIDPGDQLRKITQALDKHKLRPGLVINTHGHYDHIGCDDKFGVTVCIHKDDLAMLKDSKLNFSAFFSFAYEVKSEIKLLSEFDIVGVDGISLKVLHIPGHTRGGISLLLEKPEKNIVFTGDSLFYSGIGRSDLEGGDQDLLVKSIREKLLVLPDDTKVYPGHGPSTSIGEEKRTQPFLKG